MKEQNNRYKSKYHNGEMLGTSCKYQQIAGNVILGLNTCLKKQNSSIAKGYVAEVGKI